MVTDIHEENVVVLDFGSQYTQLIARRIRELGVYCEIHPHDVDFDSVRALAPRGIVLSGGPESVAGPLGLTAPVDLFDYGVPILGICYGMQTIAAQLGGRVVPSDKREFGYARVIKKDRNELLGDLVDETVDGQQHLDVWMSHGDKVAELPPGFRAIAETANTRFAGICDEERRIYGLQFHPEVSHTLQGAAILQRFTHDVCGCRGLWSPANIIEDIVTHVRAQVGDDRVVLGLSGGVDSSVVAALLNRAVGDRLTCIFVDNGLLRKGEADEVMATMGEGTDNAFNLDIVRVDAEALFLERLAGVEAPEEKRKIIGNTFVEVFDQEAAKIEGASFLAQGTIYPDVIESAGHKGGSAHVIKSHHNVGGLPEDMALELVEPLRELFKDEVRRIGEELGLSERLIQRHPFPGPGLGVRILGDVRKAYADILREVDAIYMEELHGADLYYRVSQAFAVFLPVKSVGVVGDARRYEYVVALRAVETVDFMTARWARLPHEFLETVSNRIINEIADVSRVTYDISSKPPATIEWE